MLLTEVSAYHAITHALHAQILRPALLANPDISYISKHALDNAPLPFILINPLEPVTSALPTVKLATIIMYA
jgi:hypothetical protein